MRVVVLGGYPNGGHMGRTPGMDSAEIKKMIADWLKLQLTQPD